ncbi:MAG TPA: MmcQ/YjbR family DNA-binding protein [Acidimicrobiales bacterium]|nr:MmcQ/YjbR family DNA-binding protein [Acidimicrobiales bacterium]
MGSGACACPCRRRTRSGPGDAATFRVSKKIFCMAGGHDPSRPSVSLKTTREDHQALLAQGEPYFLPAYVGSKGWIGVELVHPALDWTELEELVKDSYRLIAPKKLAACLD